MSLTPKRSIALFLGAALALIAGCSGDSTGDVLGGNDAANVRLVMTTDTGVAGATTAAPSSTGSGDDPARAKSAEIQVSDAKARSTSLQQLVDIGVDLPVTVDLIALRDNGGVVELGIGSLPPDTYDQIVLVISSLTLTGQNDVRFTIEPPGGGWTVPINTDPFTVVEGEVTTIQLRFRMRSFKFAWDMDPRHVGHEDFEPEMDCEID